MQGVLTTQPDEFPLAEGSSPARDGGPLPRCVASRYELEESLGSGGMGEVFAASDARTGRRVALKLLRRSLAAPRSVERLLREAMAATRVMHPGVVQVFEAGEDHEHDVAFIAQELLVGETLRDRLVRHGRLMPAEAVAIIAPVVDALAAVHGAGVVHRDLKPENIFLEGSREALRPRVIDFGIARLVAHDDATRTRLTATGSLLGTPLYMSPEQVRGADDVDEQTDVWALGVVLFELITGQPPFARSTPHATLAAILLDPVPSPREVVAEISEPLAAVVLRCLARRRLERFGSMTELSAALRQCVPTVAPSPLPPPLDVPRRSYARWLSLAVVAVVAGVAAMFAKASLPAAPRALLPVVVAPPPAVVVTAVEPPADAAPIALAATSVASERALSPMSSSHAAAPRAVRSPPARSLRTQTASRPSPDPAAVPLPRTNGAPIVGL